MANVQLSELQFRINKQSLDSHRSNQNTVIYHKLQHKSQHMQLTLESRCALSEDLEAVSKGAEKGSGVRY